MTVKEIIEKYLQDNRFDGLCGDDCGCGLGEDFMPCMGEGSDICEPAYKIVCTPGGEYDEIFVVDKEEYLKTKSSL